MYKEAADVLNAILRTEVFVSEFPAPCSSVSMECCHGGMEMAGRLGGRTHLGLIQNTKH